MSSNSVVNGSSQSHELTVLRLRPRSVLFVLLACTISLVAAHVAAFYLQVAFDNRYSRELFQYFALDGEGNFPSYFSSALLGSAGFLFLFIGKHAFQNRDRSWKWWCGLACVFWFLSLDEAVQIHEKFDNNSLLSFLNTSGLLAWPWVILYGVLVIAFLLVYAGFWWSLPPRYRVRFAGCAVLFVLAAIGFEMLGALEYTSSDGRSAKYVLLYTIEEAAEMTAICFLNYYLLTYFFWKSSALIIEDRAD